MDMAVKSGIVLADFIMSRATGERPYVLIGYSMGSRVIYFCLKELAKQKASGLVETVVLMGAPIAATTEQWRLVSSVVSGRLVNW